MNASKKSVVAAATLAAVASTIAAPKQEQASAQYATPWSRDDAYSIGSTGLGERYVGANSHWIDNNVWDDPSVEGADCSGYAGKVWADPVATAIGVNHLYPWTGTWYTNQMDGAIEIPLTSTQFWYKMDVWVWNNGAEGHMGVFEGTHDGTSSFKVWHAKGSQYGIVSETKSLSYFTGAGMKRFKRVNWGQQY